MSIPLILASQSRPRRDVLFSAGICPTIRVSHVDEPTALEREAAALGVAVDDLSVEQRVMFLATAKAEAVTSPIPRRMRVVSAWSVFR